MAYGRETVEDTIYPFGEAAGNRIEANKIVWTLGLNEPVPTLYFASSDRWGKTPLNRLSFLANPTLDDFESCDAPIIYASDFEDEFPGPYWVPQLDNRVVTEKNVSFIGRILKDFDFQWRHILANNCRKPTMLRMAAAVTKIAALDFEIKEIQTPLHRNARKQILGKLMDLPDWEPFPVEVTRVGRTWVMACLNLVDGLEKIRSHRQQLSRPRTGEEYLILSVRHLVLCRFDKSDTLQYTNPAPLLDGSSSFSPSLNLLIHALTPLPITTPLPQLPLELQDEILSHVSIASVKAAQMACILGIGLPTTWIENGRLLTAQYSQGKTVEGSPVQSQVYFGTKLSGVSYYIEDGDESDPRTER